MRRKGVLDRSVPRKPCPMGGVKGHNMNDKSLPGSPVLWVGSFTSERLENGVPWMIPF